MRRLKNLWNSKVFPDRQRFARRFKSSQFLLGWSQRTAQTHVSVKQDEKDWDRNQLDQFTPISVSSWRWHSELPLKRSPIHRHVVAVDKSLESVYCSSSPPLMTRHISFDD